MNAKRKYRGRRPAAANHVQRPRHPVREPAFVPNGQPMTAEPVPSGPLQTHEGVLEMHPKGYGFLRSVARNYLAQPTDPYVPGPLIQKLGLREGMQLTGPVEPGRGSAGPRLVHVDAIEGMEPQKYPRRKFDELTPIDPTEHIRLETGTEPLTTRVMDLLTP